MADADAAFMTPAPQEETREVKEVTEGVKEVDLDGHDNKAEAPIAADEAAPETVPLPEETSGELDEPVSSATAIVPGSSEDKIEVPGETTTADDDVSDVASSSGEPTASEEKEMDDDAKSTADTEPTIAIAQKPDSTDE